MARDVQQENIYERKTKVIKKKGRWGRYHISFSLVIFDNRCCVIELIYSWFRSWIPWDPNETISHAYTSTILNITISDYSLPIILELFHKVIFKIFRAVFPWSGQLMRPCCMVNIPPKVTCKYNWLLPVAIFQQGLLMLIRTWILCPVKKYVYVFHSSFILFMSIVT